MTKAELGYLLQRYRFIAKALNKNQQKISFYVGNRKETIIIDERVKAVISIVDDVLRSEKAMIAQIIRYRFKLGYSDEKIILSLPLSRSTYYRLKRTIENKIYQLCIYRGLVSYDELLNEKIG